MGIGVLRALLPLITVQFLFFFGLQFVAWGFLQIHVKRKQPTDLEIEKFLNTLHQPLSTIFTGGSNGHLFFYRHIGGGSLYNDLIDVRDTPLSVWMYLIALRFLYPFLLGSLFVVIAIVLFGSVTAFGEGFDKLLAAPFLLISLWMLYRSVLFGSNMVQ